MFIDPVLLRISWIPINQRTMSSIACNTACPKLLNILSRKTTAADIILKMKAMLLAGWFLMTLFLTIVALTKLSWSETRNTIGPFTTLQWQAGLILGSQSCPHHLLTTPLLRWKSPFTPTVWPKLKFTRVKTLLRPLHQGNSCPSKKASIFWFKTSKPSLRSISWETSAQKRQTLPLLHSTPLTSTN